MNLSSPHIWCDHPDCIEELEFFGSEELMREHPHNVHPHDVHKEVNKPFYCKNPFSNRCDKTKGVEKYNKLCPISYYDTGFNSEEECKSKCKTDNCNSEGNALSGYFETSDHDRSSFDFVLDVRFHQLFQTFESTENTIENFNKQKEIFKELLKMNRASPHDLGHETWFRDTKNMLSKLKSDIMKLNKKMLLKILNLDPTFKILDEEIWNKLNSKINLVVEYITEYPVLIKLLINNLQNSTRTKEHDYFIALKFFPYEGNVWMNQELLDQELLDLPHKFPIEPHKFMTNLAKDINADSDRLIKSLAPTI